MSKDGEDLEKRSIELFSLLCNLLNESGQELLFQYDCIIHKIYEIKLKK